MTAPHIIATRQQQALSELTTILEKYDPEAAARLAKTNHGGGVPTIPTRARELQRHSPLRYESASSLV